MTAETMPGRALDCGHPPTPQAPGSCATGYGMDAEGRLHCYDCCTEGDRASIRAGDRVFLYLSPDGNSVANWPGRRLMRVTRETERRAWGFGGWHKRTFVRAVDDDGREWYGQGPGRGMFVRLRRRKG